ncbi:hypothetical protein [Actinokineospora terrae]|uniref:hypothetical protein n=1 Tax=Actinokineospora terrae TaxID=155974 RepID=UPI001160E032|nr:hypothetical protein [Actinokineospora terrae]
MSEAAQFHDHHQAQAWFNHAAPALLQCLRAATDPDHLTDTTIAAAIPRIADAMLPWARLHLPTDSAHLAITVHTAAHLSARGLGDQPIIDTMTLRLARAHLDIGDATTAAALIDTTSTKDPVRVGEVMILAALVIDTRGDHALAHERLILAVNHHQHNDDPRGEATALTELGALHLRQHRPHDARVVLERAHALLVTRTRPSTWAITRVTALLSAASTSIDTMLTQP